MARFAVWIVLLCAVAAGAQAKTLPVAISRRHGQHQTPPPTNSAAPAPLQARKAGPSVLGPVGNNIGGLLGGGTPTPTASPAPTPRPTAPTAAGLTPWLIEPAHRNCGTAPLDAAQRAVQALELAPFLAALLGDVTSAVGSTAGGLLAGGGLGRRLASSGSVPVNVYFTVNRIGALGDASNGDVPASALDQQVTVMNQLMSNTPFTFVNAGVSRISNLSWWNIAAPGTLMNDMKAATRVGNFADLNIWTTVMQDNTLGLTTVPYNTGGSGDPLDGMVLTPYTLPGQAYSEYNLGVSGVHELGHWLGLDHPFYSGCAEPNDLVSDTAEMADPQLDCTAANSCPNRPPSQGNTDPIHDLMGYTPDACMTDPMTPMQSIRMQAMWNAYRSPFSASGQAGAGMTQTVPPLAPSTQQPTGGPSPTTPAPIAAPQSTTTTPQPTGGGGGIGTPISVSTPSAPSGGSGGIPVPAQTPSLPAVGGSGATPSPVPAAGQPTSAPVEPAPVPSGGSSGTVDAAPPGGSTSAGTTSGGISPSGASPSSGSSPSGGSLGGPSPPTKGKPAPKPKPGPRPSRSPSPPSGSPSGRRQNTADVLDRSSSACGTSSASSAASPSAGVLPQPSRGGAPAAGAALIVQQPLGHRPI